MPSLNERVLAHLHEIDKPASVRELVRELGLESEGRRELKSVLRGLLASGDVVKIRGARVGLPSRMNLVAGRLICNPAGYGFVAPDDRRKGERDVYVSGQNLKGALHGDRVLARVERQTPKGLEGRIIRVLERSLQRIVGRYESDGRAGGHVVPFDRRVLHELFVPAGEEKGATSGVMVSAEITRPPTATRNPAGRVLEVLGRLEERGVDLKVVMAKYALPDAFPEEVEAEAARVPTKVRAEQVADRRDFRGLLTVTVDPETARDHDDAISLERLQGGRWRLSVHIADVAFYVREGSLLDREAYARGTSVYFPERVVPMLPHALSSHICSLVDGQDRLTQSVVLELDRKGAVLKAEFHDGVIRSAARMTYQQVQACVDGDAAARKLFAPLVPLFLDMDELSKRMRERRYERGSLDFDLPEPKLVLDEAGEMVGIVASERLSSMRAIEEFMLAANEAVAGRLSEAGVGALYRIHETPDPEKVVEFSELVASFGYRVRSTETPTSSRAIDKDGAPAYRPEGPDLLRSQDFQGILRQVAGKPEEKLVSYLLLRTMKLARYHEENLGHFGLAAERYAHFTSPIRRYPDLVVHRALRALRTGGTDERAGAWREALPEWGRHLSEMERRASDAERELIEWKKVRFMADKLGEVFPGYVTGVQAFGLFVELDEVYVQGLVHVSTMSDDYYQFEERAHLLRGANNGRVYRLGDRTSVRLVRADLERRQLDFALEELLTHAARRGAPERPRPPSRPARDKPRHEREPRARAARRPRPKQRGRRR